VTLLENLRYVRKRLMKSLPEDIAHDLLARMIFIQFLFQRKDSRGKAALNPDKLETLHQQGVLSQTYQDLPAILQDKSDTFALFQWLNSKFNGDLFPTSYGHEEESVKRNHLDILADFVSGRLKMKNGQYLLWPHYSFDAIPLEFISSIYEEFVTKRKSEELRSGIGEHYTRPFLVDFMLDKVLPWGGTDYSLKILDPCCGSAIFLVKAFQRLVYRWRTANPGKEPTATFLRKLLEENLFGIDIEPKAIRVASFSLYLAMCDEIDPRHYWSQVRFPNLREVTLHASDFFSENLEGINSEADAGIYDLIIGNAPWGGQNSLTETARQWAENNDWKAVDKQSGPLFLPKTSMLCKDSGRICLIQPAGALLFNVSPTALEFRKKLFDNYKVDEVVNLSNLRFLNLFPQAVGPVCIITVRPIPPDDAPLAYWSPKQPRTNEDQYRIVIDAQDLSWVWPEEAANKPVIWPTLMWGCRRDLELIQKLAKWPKTLNSGIKTGGWQSERGFQRGTKEASPHPERLGFPILEEHTSKKKIQNNGEAHSIIVSASQFPINDNPRFERERKIESYQLPALIVKESWPVTDRRFRYIVVIPDLQYQYLLYSQSFYGIRAPSEQQLATFALVVRSSLAVHFFYLSSGRLASYRPTLLKSDLEKIPLPLSEDISLDQLKGMTEEEIDAKAFDFYKLNSVERAIVEDFFSITLRDFKDVDNPPGRAPVYTSANGQCDKLEIYCKWFIDILRSGFGDDKPICASIFVPDDSKDLPFCLIGIHLEWPNQELINYVPLSNHKLLEKLLELDRVQMEQHPGCEGIYYQRVSRIYQCISARIEGKSRKVPTVFVIKPNQVRYWTRSIAMRDADEVAVDICHWSQMNTVELEGN